MSDSENATGFDWFGPDASTFGDRLAGARDTTGMSQHDLARRLGVKVTTLSAWEEDRSEPRANRLQMLSGLLNVSLTWLISGQGEGPDGPMDVTELDTDVSAILLEIRTIKTEMSKTADRLGHLEKRLRKTLERG